MVDTHITHGALQPLFDRLAYGEPAEPVVLDVVGLARSVEQELTRLLNTRSPLGMHATVDADHSAISYGLPDFQALGRGSDFDESLLIKALHRTIAAFEPRLTQVEVKLLRSAHSPAPIRIEVSGHIKIEPVVKRVKFEIAARGQSE